MHMPYGARRAAMWGLIGGGLAGGAVGLAVLAGLSDTALVVPAAAIAAVAAAGTRLQIGEARRLADRTSAQVGRVAERLPEILAAAEFSGMDVPYPLPLGGSHALKWDASAILAHELAVTRPSAVLELGSGGSSLLIGLVLQRLGAGHLWTLDHDPGYAARTRAHVRALGLADWVSVLDAPLVDVDVAGRRYRWYRLPPEVEALAVVDFLVVDGPPQRIDPEGEPRYPALPLLGRLLGPDAVVFIDDAKRAAEARMIDRWLEEQPGWTSLALRTQGGTTILRRAGMPAAP